MQEKILNIKKNIADEINQKIKSGEVKMKPKWHFILKGVLIMSFILVLFLSAIYIGNFITLVMHDSNDINEVMKNINPLSIFVFMHTLPWLLILLMSLFIFTLYELVRNYAFVYKRPMIYSALFIFIVIIAIILNIRFLDKNFSMARFGENDQTPFLQDVHKYYRPDFFAKEKNVNDFLEIQNALDMASFPILYLLRQ